MIITHPDDRLRELSKPVEWNKATINLIKKLTAILDSTRTGVGISAIQIGIPRKVAVIYTTNKERIALLNPTIIEKEGEILSNEWCLSCPNVFKHIKRATKINVAYTTKFGNSITRWFGGGDAVVIQHEIDHMDGKLIVDYE